MEILFAVWMAKAMAITLGVIILLGFISACVALGIAKKHMEDDNG